jgi:protein-tyrosine phosphatase
MKVLFVCLGNICRSPLAKGIMDHKIRVKGLDAEADSAGFEGYHVGEGADPRSDDIARKNGLSLSGHRARRFRVEDFDRFDKIYVMDSNNYADVMSVTRNDDDAAKVEFIMNKVQPGQNHPVPDPYYGGKDGFKTIYQMLDEACERIADEIAAHQKS